MSEANTDQAPPAFEVRAYMLLRNVRLSYCKIKRLRVAIKECIIRPYILLD